MTSDDKLIRLSPDSTPVPESLLLAHARGETLLLCGAGISVPSGLPTFEQLVLDVYERLDPSVHSVLKDFIEARWEASKVAGDDVVHCNGTEGTRPVAPEVNTSSLRDAQAAEARKFQVGELDVVLGMLERRLDGSRRRDSMVRLEVDRRLRRDKSGCFPQPNALHRAVRRIADRSVAVTVATTNFDRLLEKTRPSRTRTPPAHALSTIPRPDRTAAFAGILHIHGLLDRTVGKSNALVLTDEDFAEVYSNRTVIRDLVYDTARLYDIVLVGYSANDPPMRYLLNAISADRVRFPDLRRCYAFVSSKGVPDGVELASWRARGIEPIPYDDADGHRALRITLERWAALSPHEVSGPALDATIKRVVKRAPSHVSEDDRNLFDHLVRRGNAHERLRIIRLVTSFGADIAWLEEGLAVLKEPRRSPGTPLVPGTGIDVIDLDRQVRQAVVEFARERLDERGVVEWAADLPPTRRAERFAVLDVVHFDVEGSAREPWSTAWSLIEESWAGDVNDDSRRLTVHEVERRLRSGERSAMLAREIAEHVTPRVRVRSRSEWDRFSTTARRRGSSRRLLPKNLLHKRMVSVDLVDPSTLGLDHVSDAVFLKMLADELDAALVRGMGVAERLGLNRGVEFGIPSRVYYDRNLGTEQDSGDRDAMVADELTAVIKLLHETVRRLATYDSPAASAIVRRWAPPRSPIHTRLWAAMAQDVALVSDNEVSGGLLATGHQEFWDITRYPEVAELRSGRLGQLPSDMQLPLLSRLRKGPPRAAIYGLLKGEERDRWRRQCAVRELERVRLGCTDGTLLPQFQRWLDGHLHEFPEIVGMTAAEGLDIDLSDLRTTDETVDDTLDALVGTERLDTIESALCARADDWTNPPDRAALDWMRLPGNMSKVVHDLAQATEHVGAYPAILERLGQMHRPDKIAASEGLVDRADDVTNVLAMLNTISESTMTRAMDSLSAWLFNWRGKIGTAEKLLPVWKMMWRIAVREVTELEGKADRVPPLDEPSSSGTPTGRLVEAFLSLCPKRQDGLVVFAAGSAIGEMRDAIEATSGRALLIVRRALMLSLPYLLAEDPAWTRRILIEPLEGDGSESNAYWQELSRRHRYSREVLAEIGHLMGARVLDHSLKQDVRKRLVRVMVLEVLFASLDKQESAISRTLMQRTLRGGDEPLRAVVADTLYHFVRNLSKEADDSPLEGSRLFRLAVGPFLHNTWPQERALTSPTITRSLVKLPRAVGEAFVDAVEALERYLEPFDCYTIIEYGFFGHDFQDAVLFIDDQGKAEAMLTLLDGTIGQTDSSVIPRGLSDLLNRISEVAPNLLNSSIYRRLATAARRLP